MKNSNIKVGIAGYGDRRKMKKILDIIPGIKIVAISDKNPKNTIKVNLKRRSLLIDHNIKFYKNIK